MPSLKHATGVATHLPKADGNEKIIAHFVAWLAGDGNIRLACYHSCFVKGGQEQDGLTTQDQFETKDRLN